MFENILVPTDGSEFSRTAFKYALEWARCFNAQLSLLFVVDVRSAYGPLAQDFFGFLQPTVGSDFTLKIVQLQEERGRKVLSELAGLCAAAGVGCASRVETGVVASAIVEASDEHDLVVMGQRGEHSEWPGPLLGSTLEAVARAIRTTLLVTPAEVVRAKKMLVAYDGSPNAKSALKAAAEFARAGGLEVEVLVVTDRHTDGARLLPEATAEMERRGLKAAAVSVSGHAGDVIPKTANEHGTGIVAMGAYGHTLIRELVLGGTTVQVMRRAKWPVLLHR